MIAKNSKQLMLCDKVFNLIKTAKLKTHREFFEAFWNNHFVLFTDKSRMIEAAYKHEDKLNLSINRLDYSTTYKITFKD